MRVTTSIAVAVLSAVCYLVLASEMERRDQRIAELEQQAHTAAACRPIRDGEIAAMSMRGGEIQCAVTRREGGIRKVARSM